jgi:hypothetical protein
MGPCGMAGPPEPGYLAGMTTPLEYANALSSIVGLLSLFKSEATAEKQQTLDDYLEWLRRHEHQELVDLISANGDMTLALRELLDGRHDQVMEQFAELNKVLAAVAAHVRGFKGIVASTHVSAVLSDQAVSVLRQMNDAGAKDLYELPILSGLEFSMDGKGGNLDVEDDRFIADVLLTLVELGCLRLDYGTRGTAVYSITRSGAQLGKLDS